jgi:hypothetical protein
LRIETATDLEQIAEPLGRDECGAGALALYEGVDDVRRAVLEDRRLVQVSIGVGQAIQNASNEVSIVGQRLAELGRLRPLVEDDNVGECAAGVCGKKIAHESNSFSTTRCAHSG